MALKYAALTRLTSAPPGPVRDVAMRSAAGAWPGCLREAQLVPPPEYARRAEAAAAASDGPELQREQWRGAGLEAIPLWADLHERLSDVQAWRAQRPAGSRRDPASFYDALPSDARDRWPDAALRDATVVGAASAYACLAFVAGLTRVELEAILLARV